MSLCATCDPQANFVCNRHIASFLKRENELLKAKIQFLQQKSSLYLEAVGNYQIAQYKKEIREVFDTDFINIDRLNNLCHYPHCNRQYQMLTITFDPSMFGHGNHPVHEKNYILFILYKCIKKGFFNSFIGCFEMQKRGAIHAHLAIDLKGDETKLYQYLKRKFTNNPFNNHAIDLGKHALFAGWLCYINGCNKGQDRADHKFYYNIPPDFDFLLEWNFPNNNLLMPSESAEKLTGGTVPPVDNVDLFNPESKPKADADCRISEYARNWMRAQKKYHLKEIEKIDKILEKNI